MTRTKLSDRTLPDYTRAEETINMVTHILGAIFGAVALVLCVVFAAKREDPFRIAGATVYGTALILLYTMSAVYHGLRPGMGKKVMQVLDHCTIYLLIAGTYTPILIGPLREHKSILAEILFVIVWGGCIFATIITAIDHNKYSRLSMACYIGTGWTIILAVGPAVHALTFRGFLLLLCGGVAYTLGAAIYWIGKKRQIRYMHSVFHVFVLLGTALQFVSVFRYCILG